MKAVVRSDEGRYPTAYPISSWNEWNFLEFDTITLHLALFSI
jgi:hypothetical protein